MLTRKTTWNILSFFRIKCRAICKNTPLLLKLTLYIRRIWGNGWLATWGVLDFAGGIVIHTSSGASCLVIAMGSLKKNILMSTKIIRIIIIAAVMGRRAQFEKHHGEVPASNM